MTFSSGSRRQEWARGRGERRGTRVPGALEVLLMSGAAPDADILGLLRTADGAHGLRTRAPDTLVPLPSPLTFNLAFPRPWWAPDQAPRSTRLDRFESRM